MNIYAGNLSRDVSDADLREAFEKFGKVTSAVVIKDQFSGTSRGFGFVEMPEQKEAEAALKGLNETGLKGSNMTVNEARPRAERGGHGGGRGRPSGGGQRRY